MVIIFDVSIFGIFMEVLDPVVVRSEHYIGIAFLAHRIRISAFYLDRQFLSHPCYLTKDRIKIMYLMHWLCRTSLSTSSRDIDFYTQ